VGADREDENLAGCEEFIAEFKEREKTRIAQLEAAAAAKHREKEEAAANAAAEAAQVAAAARVAAQGEAAESGGPKRSPRKAVAESTAASEEKVKQSKRSSPWWAAFDETGAPAGKACCKLLKPDTGKVCGEPISTSTATNLKNHVMWKHPDDLIKMAPAPEALYLSKPNVQQAMNVLPAKQRDQIHMAHARWLCKRKRPLSLPQDEEYHDIWTIAMRGAYTPPDQKITTANVLLLSGQGKKKLVDVNTSLRAAGIKPAMAGDIWSDRGVSLLGLCEYYMSDEWTINELVLAASPFSKERHTGEAIDTKTRDSCISAGLSHDVFSSVFFPVSDNASNMKNGWASFGRGPCCVHTGQLSVHVYLNHAAIKPTRDKEHGIVAHWSHATGVDGLGALHKCQKECNLPEHHPVKDVETRWSSGHDQMEWFRVGQRAVQLYDVNHARKAGHAYQQYQMGLHALHLHALHLELLLDILLLCQPPPLFPSTLLSGVMGTSSPRLTLCYPNPAASSRAVSCVLCMRNEPARRRRPFAACGHSRPAQKFRRPGVHATRWGLNVDTVRAARQCVTLGHVRVCGN